MVLQSGARLRHGHVAVVVEQGPRASTRRGIPFLAIPRLRISTGSQAALLFRAFRQLFGMARRGALPLDPEQARLHGAAMHLCATLHPSNPGPSYMPVILAAASTPISDPSTHNPSLVFLEVSSNMQRGTGRLIEHSSRLASAGCMNSVDVENSARERSRTAVRPRPQLASTTMLCHIAPVCCVVPRERFISRRPSGPMPTVKLTGPRWSRTRARRCACLHSDARPGLQTCPATPCMALRLHRRRRNAHSTRLQCSNT